MRPPPCLILSVIDHRISWSAFSLDTQSSWTWSLVSSSVQDQFVLQRVHINLQWRSRWDLIQSSCSEWVQPRLWNVSFDGCRWERRQRRCGPGWIQHWFRVRGTKSTRPGLNQDLIICVTSGDNQDTSRPLSVSVRSSESCCIPPSHEPDDWTWFVFTEPKSDVVH